jgi:general stress protein 26
MKLSDEAINFLMSGNGNSVVIVATVSEFGVVNLSPRFILHVDTSGIDDKIYFVSGLPNKTLYNLRKNSKVGISKWVNDVRGDVRVLVITGQAKNLTSGPKYDEMSDKAAQAFLNAGFVKSGEVKFDKPPKPLAVTEVIVEDVKFY